MKKLIATLVILVGAAALTPVIASQPETSETNKVTKEDVRKFFHEWQESLTSGDYDHAIEMINLNMAKDFQHIDDDEVTFDKQGFINNIEDLKNKGMVTKIGVDVLQIHQEEGIITANIDVKQSFYKKNEETGELTEVENDYMHLNCTDSLRLVDDDERFELFQCKCNVLAVGREN